MNTQEGNPYTTSPYRDDLEADRTADGIVTNDSSFVQYPTRSQVKFERQKEAQVKEWTEEQQEKIFTFSMQNILDTMVSKNDPEVSRALYESSGVKETLIEFIEECKSQFGPLRALMEAAKKEGKKVEVLSFSRMRRPILDRIGVKHHDVAEWFELGFVQRYMGDGSSGQSRAHRIVQQFDVYWPGNSESSTYIRYLGYYMGSVPYLVEASSRSVIDTIISGLVDVMLGIKYEQVHIPELKVRLINDGETPVVTVIDIVGSDGDAENEPGPPAAIILRGAIDYVIVSKPSNVVRSNSTTDNSMSDLRSRLIDNYDISSVFSGPMNEFRIFIVEAKRAPPSKSTGDPEKDAAIAIERLNTHEPQVIAEAMACVKYKERQRDSQRNGSSVQEEAICVPWCLTDGEHWVFGVLVYTTDSNRAPRWDNFRLGRAWNDRMSWKTTSFASISKDVKKSKPAKVAQTGLRRLSVILLLLTTGHADKCFESLFDKIK